jgi:hypothetical protein
VPQEVAELAAANPIPDVVILHRQQVRRLARQPFGSVEGLALGAMACGTSCRRCGPGRNRGNANDDHARLAVRSGHVPKIWVPRSTTTKMKCCNGPNLRMMLSRIEAGEEE